MNAAEIRHGTDLARDMQRRPRVPRARAVPRAGGAVAGERIATHRKIHLFDIDVPGTCTVPC